MTLQRSRFALLAMALAVSAIPSAAATIGIGSTSLPGASTGTLGPVINTSPNNDNSAGNSPNVVTYSIFQNTFGTIEVEFLATNSGGTTEYRFVQALFNTAGPTWQGYSLELGFGTGANFLRSGAGDGLDFDSPTLDPAPNSNRFSTVNAGTDTLVFSGGAVNQFQTTSLNFHIDVPDNLNQFNPSGQNRFTLRQVALLTPGGDTAVPEPSVFWMFGGGLLAVAMGKLRVQRQRK
jgi:hypothetical protein